MADSFFKELKRRNVFKVSVGYLLLGWVVLQIADVIVPAANLPEWTITFLLVVGALGFPFAIFFAWAFEITPDGVRRETDISAEESITAHTGRKLDFTIIGLLVVALGYFVYESRFQEESNPEISSTSNTKTEVTSAATTEILSKTIAVLPFANFSSDKEQGWFADGLTEELLNALARTRDLLVSSRTSSFAYKGSDKDIKTIADELGVEHILEGSVRRAGDQIRVTAQLIRAKDGFHLWSETYDRKYTDIIIIQEEVAISIANALDTVMDPESLRKMIRVGTSSVEAYEAFLEATVPDGSMIDQIPKKIKLLERAVELDNNFSRALGTLGNTWLFTLDISTIGNSSKTPPEDRFKKGIKYLDRAIAMEGDTVDAKYYQGVIAQYSLRYTDAETIYQNILLTNPSHRLANYVLPRIKADMGKWSELLEYYSKADTQVLQDAEFAESQIVNLALSQNTKAAARVADKAREQFPRNRMVAYQSHRAYLMNGELDKASKALRTILASTLPEESMIIAQLRQACVERNFEEAEKLYKLADEVINKSPATQWLISKTYGDDEKAYQLIKHLDNSTSLVGIASFMNYYHFDINRHPNLLAEMKYQGIVRQKMTPMVIRCDR